MDHPKDFNQTICNAALEYADRGWSCFPLSISDRRPIDKWRRFQTEHPMTDEIDAWSDMGAPRSDTDGNPTGYEKYFNLALVTGNISGFVVVDCDNQEAIEFAEKKGITSPVTVKTSRGRHYYFKHPNNGMVFRNKTGANPGSSWYEVKGLDFRGDGGYVVAPPSMSFQPDGTVKHQYSWDIAPGHDFDDMPVWKGSPDNIETVEGSFDFSKLSLANVKISEGSLDVRELVERRVAVLGHKLIGPDKGYNTDAWMIRYCGQMVRRGVVGEDLWNAVVQFHQEFFEYVGKFTDLERWLNVKVRSALEMDRRNHPEDYDAAGNRLTREQVKAATELTTGEESKANAITFITSKDYSRLLASIGDIEYYADPVVPARSIIQVVGYNGHGKSVFTLALMSAISAGATCKNFGPYAIEKPAKVLYLDFDNPARTILKRAEEFDKALGGATHPNFNLWSASVNQLSINFNDPSHWKAMNDKITDLNPDIVVIDTVRNAFGGFDEKDPSHWYKINLCAKQIRDIHKATCVLVHHRNKPNEHGLGRESGSTAQLTDIDTQIMITQVYNNKDLARRKAALFDEDLIVQRGVDLFTPFQYFDHKLSRAGMKTSHRIRGVVEVSFGKTREETDLHKTSYLAYTTELRTNESGMLWTPSPREDAIAAYANGRDIMTIAQNLMIPSSQIEKWVQPKITTV